MSTITQLPPSLLPSLFSHASANPSTPPPLLITQGAEAHLYRTHYLLPSIPTALKHRPSKPYRHPILDARLTRHRILSEARVLAKCRREGVSVPGVYAINEKDGWIMMEWVEGSVVRVNLNQWLENEGKEFGVPDDVREQRDQEGRGRGEGGDVDVGRIKDLMGRIGEAVGKMHRVGVVHGDLTTSNLMLRPVGSSSIATSDTDPIPTESEGGDVTNLQGTIVIIDFGLASQTAMDEDRAVDLYVLERAFGSTHPRLESLWGEVLRGYEKGIGKEGVKVLRKLEDVRMRGRKRSMLG